MGQILSGLKTVLLFLILTLITAGIMWGYVPKPPIIGWITLVGLSGATILYLYSTLHIVRQYLIFTESFDRRPPWEFPHRYTIEPHVRQVLQTLAENLKTLFDKERALEIGEMDEDMSADAAAALKKDIKLAKRKFRQAQNAAQWYQYTVPDKFMKVIKCESMLR